VAGVDRVGVENAHEGAVLDNEGVGLAADHAAEVAILWGIGLGHGSVSVYRFG
jgi:hypothetical protein